MFLMEGDIRLITILAPGGMGKTRLAQEVAQRTLAAFSDGVIFVPLAALDSAARILPAISENIEVFQVIAGVELEKQLMSYLRERRMLLVLDNFEQVLSGASMVAAILNAAPDVKLLVTSREKLNLSGEQVFALGGMDFPDWETPSDAHEYSAVQLFMQQARLARHDFEIRGENLNYLARICRLVAGMPLGLVLAAAWVEVLSLQEIADEISQSYEFLEAGKRDLPERQHSIHAVFDTTWKRLSDMDQQSFMKLALFRGGFTRQAGEAVAGATVQTLQRLMSKALVSRTPEGRYEIHELLRQYAEEQLIRSGDGEAVREAHSRYYLSLLAELEPDIKGHRQAEALHEITVDFANVRMAWKWAVEANRLDWISDGLECITIYAWYQSIFQDQAELFRYPRITLMSRGENPLLCSRMVIADALSMSLVFFADRGDAPGLLEWALDIAQQHNNQPHISICLFTLGFYAYLAGDHETGITYFSEGIARSRIVGDTFYRGWALMFLGSCTRHIEGLDNSTPLFQESLELRRVSGDSLGEGFTRSNFAINLLLAGSLFEAEIEFNITIEFAREIFQSWGVVVAFLGWIAAFRGQLVQAQKLCEEALQDARDTQFVPDVSNSSSLNAAIACLQEHYEASLQSGLKARAIITLSYYIFFADWALSLAYCGLEDYGAARANTHKALTYAYQIKGEGAMTWCLPPAAVLLAHDSQTEQAVELIALAYHHPASATGWLDQWPLLARLKNRLHELAPK